MVAYNKKQRNKRKIPAVLPATVGTIAGVGGTAALTKAYLLRQQEYANNKQTESLLHKTVNNTKKGILDKNANGTYANAGEDGVYTKEEYLKAIKDHYYTTSGSTTTFNKEGSGVTKEYADSIIEQAQNDPNLFIDGTVRNDKVLLKGKLDTTLDTNSTGVVGEGKLLTSDQWKEFKNTLTDDVKQETGITEASFESRFKDFCTKNNISTEDTNSALNSLKGSGATSIFGEGKVVTKVVNTEYADNAAVYERMSNNATKQNFSFTNSLQNARETVATKIGNNSLICKEIAKSTGTDVYDVASKAVDATAALGIGLTAGLAAMGANKLFKKVGNYLNKKKEERAEKKEQKVAEMKRSLSQTKAANAMQVQMAGDFENTASNGRFNNRG